MTRRAAIGGVLRLVRVSSFATAPSDVLAGAFLAAAGGPSPPAGRLAAAAAASVLLYWGGLIFNDLCDRAADARARPERPLVSGRVSPAAARGFLVGALASALALAWLAGPLPVAVAAVLAAASLLYSARWKHTSLGAALGMGTCRVLDLGLGLAAGGIGTGGGGGLTRRVASLASLYFAYIALVTLVARFESRRTGPRAARIGAASLAALAAGVAGAAAALTALPGSWGGHPLGIPPLAFLAALLATGALRLGRIPGRAPLVRGWVRDAVLGILLWNGGVLLGAGRPILGGAVSALFFVSLRIARRVSPS